MKGTILNELAVSLSMSAPTIILSIEEHQTEKGLKYLFKTDQSPWPALQLRCQEAVCHVSPGPHRCFRQAGGYQIVLADYGFQKHAGIYDEQRLWAPKGSGAPPIEDWKESEQRRGGKQRRWGGQEIRSPEQSLKW